MPRIPVWVAGSVARSPLQRAARWDGYFPIGLNPDQLRAQLALIEKMRSNLDNFEVAVMARPNTNTKIWFEAGATWHLTTGGPDISAKELEVIIKTGPTLDR